MKLSPSALDLVIRFEVTSKANYEKKLKKPTWPTGASGVTIGIGYDLGHVSAAEFDADFQALSEADRTKLKKVIGLTGLKARDALAQVQSVEVPWDMALAVFEARSIDKYFARARRAFPGMESLHEDIQGALWSLVYNRGESMSDPDPNHEPSTPPPGSSDRRWEMRQIRAAVLARNPHLIPGLIRSMKRIWKGEPIELGMIARREEEALLVEKGLAATAVGAVEDSEFELSPLTRVLRLNSSGEDVRELQAALKALGFDPGPADGEFGPKTSDAVRAFQWRAGLSADGEVGAKTWQALDGALEDGFLADVSTAEQKRKRLAEIAEREAKLGLKWSAGSPAEKYLKPFRAPMQKLGHIQKGEVFYNWCSAFVTWCGREAGFEIADQPQGSKVTMALAAAWKSLPATEATWYPKGATEPQPGDIVLFDWPEKGKLVDHVGVVLSSKPGSLTIQTAEGNAGNKSAIMHRSRTLIHGICRLR